MYFCWISIANWISKPVALMFARVIFPKVFYWILSLRSSYSRIISRTVLLGIMGRISTRRRASILKNMMNYVGVATQFRTLAKVARKLASKWVMIMLLSQVIFMKWITVYNKKLHYLKIYDSAIGMNKWKAHLRLPAFISHSS